MEIIIFDKMKNLLFILIFFCSLNGFGQDFGDLYTIGNLTKIDVKNRIQKDIEKGRFYKNIPSVINEIGDTLIYEVESTYYKFTLKMTFNLTIDSVKYYCDFVQYIFQCEDWSIKNFKQMESFFNFYKFNEVSNSKYQSRYSWHTLLTINYDSNKEGCLIFTYNHFDTDKTKKEYSAYHKTLKRIEYKSLPYPFN